MLLDLWEVERLKHMTEGCFATPIYEEASLIVNMEDTGERYGLSAIFESAEVDPASNDDEL